MSRMRSLLNAFEALALLLPAAGACAVFLAQLVA